MIELTNVTKLYGEGESAVRALDNVSLTIKQGEFIAVMGPSGSGKSTLLNILGCLDSPTKGKYLLAGKDVSRLKPKDKAGIRNRCIGFVFQSFNLLADLSALENVGLTLEYSTIPKRERQKRAYSALKEAGIVDLAQRYPDELSGGQQQRVAIARALVNQPEIILADEPTGNLDSATSKSIINTLAELTQTGKRTVLVVTHDPTVASSSKRILQMVDGRIIDDLTVNKRKISFGYPLAEGDQDYETTL